MHRRRDVGHDVEVVDQARILDVGRRNTGLGQAAGIVASLVLQRVEPGRHHQGRRQVAAQLGAAQEGAARLRMADRGQRLVEPGQRRLGQDRSVQLLARGGLHLRPDARIEQQLEGDLAGRVVLQVDGDRGRQVAAGRVAADRDALGVHAQVVGVVERPLGRRQRVVVAGRERMLRRQPVVDRQHPHAGQRGQPPAVAVMGLQVADGEAAAVEIDQAAAWGLGAGGGVQPRWDRTGSAADLQVLGRDVLRRVLVGRLALHLVAHADHGGRHGVQRRGVRGLLGGRVDHRFEVGVEHLVLPNDCAQRTAFSRGGR